MKQTEITYQPIWVASILCFLVLLSPAYFVWEHINFDSSAKNLLAQDRRSEMSYDKMKQVLNNNTLIFFAIECDEVLNKKNIENIALLSNELSALQDCVYLNSLTHMQRPVIEDFKITDFFTKSLSQIRNDTLKFKPFIDWPIDDKTDFKKIRGEIMKFPIGPDLVLSRNHEAVLISLVLSRDLSGPDAKLKLEKEIRNIAAPFEMKFDAIEILSFPFLENELIQTVRDDSRLFVIAVSVLMVLILAITFRSINIILLVGLYETVGLVVVGGLMLWQLNSFNLYTGILIPLLSGLQLTFLSHTFSMWQRDWVKRENVAEAIRDTLHHILKPSFTAAITTSIGLFSLTFCEVQKIREFGLFGGLGVLVIFVVSFLPFVALWCYYSIKGAYVTHKEETITETSSSNELLDTIVNKFYNKKNLIVTIFILLCGFAIPAFSRMNTDVRALEFLNPEGKTRKALQLINDKLGGVNVFELVIDTHENDGIDRLDALQYMEKLRSHANGLKGISSAYCYSSFYAYINQLLFSTDELPNAMIISMLSKYMNQERIPELQTMITKDKRKAYFVLRNSDMPSKQYIELLEKFKVYAEKEKPENVSISIQDGIYTLLKQDRDITKSQINSLSFSLLLIFLSLLIFWLSPRLAFIAILCNTLPLLTTISIFGYFSIPLNSVTVMVSAVVFGIAVDDAIHFLSYFKSQLKKGMSPHSALLISMQHKFKPMACTSAVLVAALMLFLLSSFPPIQDFGMLAALSLATSFFSLIIFIPAWIKLFYSKNVKELSL